MAKPRVSDEIASWEKEAQRIINGLIHDISDLLAKMSEEGRALFLACFRHKGESLKIRHVRHIFKQMAKKSLPVFDRNCIITILSQYLYNLKLADVNLRKSAILSEFVFLNDSFSRATKCSLPQSEKLEVFQVKFPW